MKLLILILFVCMANCTFAQSSVYDSILKEIGAYSSLKGIKHDNNRNIYLDKDNVIHIFMFENGDLIGSGYPTTSSDRNKFQIHIYTTDQNKDTYRFEVTGSYEPSINIEGTNAKADKAKISAAGFVRLDLPIVGPFTGSVIFSVKRISGNGDVTAIASPTIKIGKTIHASIGTGFVYSSLRNPSNIRVVPVGSSTTVNTLEADNATGYNTLTLMATLYPCGRSGLMLPKSRIFKEHIKETVGIVFGTKISSSRENFKNLFLGLQYDFSIGGSIITGLDFADCQKIRGIDYKDFKFGETPFEGKLEDRLYKEIAVGFFFGVQVDTRIISKMFTSNP